MIDSSDSDNVNDKYYTFIPEGTATVEPPQALDKALIYTRAVKGGMLESTDYDCVHKVREMKENEYIEQEENVGNIGCKIYFYRTFLLFEDGYSGNEYTFVYDKIY